MADRLKRNEDDPGSVSNDMMNEVETFAPQFNATNPLPFLEAKQPYSNYLHSTDNTK